MNYTLVAAAENAGRARHQSEDALPSAEEALARGRPLLKFLASRLQSACIRTVSLRTEISVSGKPNFVSGDKGDKTCPKNIVRHELRLSSRQ